MNGFRLDLEPLFWFAIIGVIATLLLILGGGAWLIWFIINHVRIV